MFEVASTLIWELLLAREIVAGTKAVVLNMVTVAVYTPQLVVLGNQSDGNAHVVIWPKTVVVMSKIADTGC